MIKDVAIFAGGGHNIPVLRAFKIELTKSKIFQDLFKTLNICDGCKEPLSIIIDGETRADILAAFSKVTQQSGVSIIQGENSQSNNFQS